MYDPKAVTIPEATGETSKALSNTVLTFSDFTNLTSHADNPLVTAYRISMGDNQARWLVDEDPTVSSGHLWPQDTTQAFMDVHHELFERMRWIRDDATDCAMTITPIHSSNSNKKVFYDGYGLGLLADDSIAGEITVEATTSARGTVELATDAEMTTGTSTTLVPPVSAVQSKIDEKAYEDAGARLLQKWNERGIFDIQSAGSLSGSDGVNSGYSDLTLHLGMWVGDWTPSNPNTLFFSHNNSPNGFELNIQTSGVFRCVSLVSGPVYGVYNITPSPALTDSHFYDLWISIDMSTETITLMGADVTAGGAMQTLGSTTATGISSINFGDGNSNVMTVGNDTDTVMKLAELEIFNRVWTLEEVQTYYLTGVKPDDMVGQGSWENLVTNGDFSAWTGDDPDGWSFQGTEDAGSYVTESSGAARIVSDGDLMGITLGGLEIGSYYLLKYDITDVTLGSIKSYGTQVTIGTTVDSYSIAFKATNTVFGFLRNEPCDVTIDNVEIYPLGETLQLADFNDLAQVHSGSGNHLNILQGGGVTVEPKRATATSGRLVYENVDCSSDTYLGGAVDVLPENAVVTGVSVVNNGGSDSTGINVQRSDGTTHTDMANADFTVIRNTGYPRAYIFVPDQTSANQMFNLRRLRVPAATSGGTDLTFIINYEILNY